MKPLVYFLIFYVLMLTVVPCHCRDLCWSGCGEGAEWVDNAQTEDTDETEMCTPFCLCTAMHGANFFVETPKLLHAPSAHVESIVVYQDPKSCEFHSNFWRPPME